MTSLVARHEERIATAFIRRFAQVRALVVGDALVDVYHWGRVERLSPEAPVPVFIEERVEERRGGADNVLHQLDALGCGASGVFGSGRSRKHRYFAGHHQIFRHDRDEISDGPGATDMRALQFSECDVLVLSDYGKGMLSAPFCQRLIEFARVTGIPCVVDPKGADWEKYAGCDVICPNEVEMKAHLAHPAPTKPVWKAIVHKRGRQGLEIITDGGVSGDLIPACAQQVYDVTGAGDVVTAVIAAGLAAGASLHEAAAIANAAAGIVVGRLGTAVCSKDELLATV